MVCCFTMAPSALLVFLSLLLSSSDSLPPPRTSFLLNSVDRPLVHFSLPGVQNITTLLLSDDGSTLYVGARDAVLSLNVSQPDVISLKQKVTWSPSAEGISSCELKGKYPKVCPNFVHVMQPLNSTHLYVCGSYAFNPQQAYIDMESFSLVHQGKGHCPFSPSERSSALIIDEELFSATTTDFRGLKPQISRHFSRDRRPDVNLDTSIRLLEEPTFLASWFGPAQQKLYFFFSEVGKEFRFVDEVRISRVAQVCKDDVGGQRTLQKKWTSFAKASLLCQASKQLLFNVLQDVFSLQPPEGSDASETLFYGIFTSQWSTRPESAVCTFSLKDIRAVFTGAYKTLDITTQQWGPLQERRSFLGKCGLANYSDSDLGAVRKSFLTGQNVKPVGQVLVSAEQKYSRVAVMRTQAANGKQYEVLFLLTETGLLHKVVLFDQGPQVIEEIQVFTQPQLVKSLVLSSSQGVLYVGTFTGVTAVPVARCSIYRSCGQCVLARDPLCGWSRTRKVCTGLDGGQEDVVQNLENSSMEDECRGESRNMEPKEVYVHLNEAVRLQCQKPSSLATLTWTSSQTSSLQEKLFIHSANSSFSFLSFLASTGTFGNYSCEAEEGGFREVIVSYSLRQIPSPRHLSKVDESVSTSPDEIPENIWTEEPVFDDSAKFVTKKERKSTTHKEDPRWGKNLTETSGDHVTLVEGDQFSTKTNSIKEGSLFYNVIPTSEKNSQSVPVHPSNEIQNRKSYYNELVAVSFLLAASIIILFLGLLHIRRQQRKDLRSDCLVAPGDFGNTNTSIEICSLSSPESPDQNAIQ